MELKQYITFGLWIFFFVEFRARVAVFTFSRLVFKGQNESGIDLLNKLSA